jgi:hypothetical protein
MRVQIVEADFKERPQEARSDAAARILHGDAAEAQASILASDILQDRKSCNIVSLARQIISAGRVFDRSGMLRGLPPANEPRIALAALEAHHGRDVRFGCGVDFHVTVTTRGLSGQNV